MRKNEERKSAGWHKGSLRIGLIVLLGLVVMLFVEVYLEQKDRSYKALTDNSHTLLENSKDIIYLDEVLTMSARMYASSAEPQWRARYFEHVSQLEQAFATVQLLEMYSAEGSTILKQTEQANQQLVELEKHSFQLVEQGRKEEAFQLLISPDYLTLKERYAAGIERYLSALELSVQAALRDMEQAQQRNHFLQLILFLLIIITTWGIANYLLGYSNRRLSSSLSRLQAIHESTEEGLLIVDLQGNIADFNRRFAEIWRLPLEQLETLSDKEALSLVLSQLKNPTQFISKVESLYAQPEAVSDDLLEFADGRMVSRHTRPQYQHGEVVGRIWNFRDITDLTDLQRRYEIVKETSQEGIHVLDRQGNVVDCSPSFAQMLGYSLEEALRLNVQEWDALLPMSELERVVNQIMQKGRTFETVHRRKDGSTFAVEVSAWGVEFEGVKHLYAVSRDITERKQAEEAKANFLATMSHELRTPLATIIGNSEELLKSGHCGSHSCGEADAIDIISSIQRAGKTQLALVNDILDMSKIESGKFTVDEAPYNLEALLADLRQMFKLRAKDQGISFEIRQEYAEQRMLLGDGQRIGQILINLIGNAIKFTDQGGVTLRVRQDGEQLYFKVEDSGIGMSPEVVGQLFERFHQADGSISRRFGGTGLGLYISYNLAEMMQGTIEVSSVEGVGSTFELRLPYSPTTQPVRVVSSEAGESVLQQRFHGRVLIAEDTPELQLLERRILESVGVTVDVANDGREAVEQAMAEPFDLILMDMQMPVMDGIEATRQLRAEGVKTPVVPLTANVMQKHRQAFAAVGCREFLSKPIDRFELVKVLNRYLMLEQDHLALVAMGITDRRKSSRRQEEIAVIGDERILPRRLKDRVSRQLEPVAEVEAEVDDELMAIFQNSTLERRAALLQALELKDWSSARTLAHAIKGSAASFGYPALSASAEQLQLAIDESRLEQIPSLIEVLLQQLDEVG